MSLSSAALPHTRSALIDRRSQVGAPLALGQDSSLLSGSENLKELDSKAWYHTLGIFSNPPPIKPPSLRRRELIPDEGTCRGGEELIGFA